LSFPSHLSSQCGLALLQQALKQLKKLLEAFRLGCKQLIELSNQLGPVVCQVRSHAALDLVLIRYQRLECIEQANRLKRLYFQAVLG
jgi:hypothetical protein